MKIKFLTQAAEKAGRKEIELSLDQPVSARQLLSMLADKLAEASTNKLEDGQHYLFDNKTKALSDDYYLLLNGRHLMTLEGLETQITNTDLVHIIPVTEAG